jgi:hypothetical protein
MDFDARLKALATLSESSTEAAERALRRELENATTTLAAVTEYDQLEQSLSVINTVGFRFSGPAVDALASFTQSIDSRTLTYSEQDRFFGGAFERYRNAATLIGKVIESLVRLRYLETSRVLHALMRLSVHPVENVRTKALKGLEDLAGYDIRIFYGDGERAGIGAAPQSLLLDEFGKLSESDILTYFSAALTVLDGVLSPTMESASWSYKALTLSNAATPAMPAVGDVRSRSIQMLIGIYALSATVSQKLRVVGSLTGATRADLRSPRSADLVAMYTRDACAVLEFFSKRVLVDELEIAQKIEHNSYWIFHHAVSKEVEAAALNVRDRIAERQEYQIYRVLIGFEGIFGDWQDLKATGVDWPETDKLRHDKARQYAAQIDVSNYAEWRSRILQFAQVKSDDLATFPIFYFFLEHFAIANPRLALRFLSDDTDAIKGFMIPLLRGLWSGSEREHVRILIQAWMSEGRYLYPAIKQFLSNPDLDIELARQLLFRAAEVNDLSTIREAVSVAVSNSGSGREYLTDALLLPAIQLLTDRSSSDWLFDNWFRREMKEVLASLTPTAVDVVLRNLKHLSKVDYHAEEVLSIIARRDPQKVLDYLCARLDVERTEGSDRFEPVPFELHKLNEPLSRAPQLAVQTLRQHYRGDYSDFMHGGARLLASIFANFSEEFESELLKLVEQDGEANLQFVLAVLRNYHGQPFIHRLCKAIVKAIAADSPYRTEIAIALESTGVVSGEFGMAQAYERKRQEVLEWLTDPDIRVRDFAKWYIEDLERMRDAEQKRAEEDIALLKFHYGEE